jgi:hypothetical protein
MTGSRERESEADAEAVVVKRRGSFEEFRPGGKN